MAHGVIERFNENPLDRLDWDEFDYLIPEGLQQGIHLPDDPFLPESEKTIAGLKALGEVMTGQPDTENGANSNIPAPYTYLGQFIDHDITLTVKSETIDPDTLIGQDIFSSLPREKVRNQLKNKRTGSFDLDSIYGLQPDTANANLAVPFLGDKFELGKVTPVLFPALDENGNSVTDAAGNVVNRSFRPDGKEDNNDLPRVPAISATNPQKAQIGDKRNDENTIIAQLHLAFLKFHNAVVDDGFAFDDARRLVTHHYQWLVLQDFLPRVCDGKIVREVLQKGNRLYRPRNTEKFMPFEFSVAAYRFGHSMVRENYDFNLNFLKPDDKRNRRGRQFEGSLKLLFKFTKESGDLDGNPTLADNWIIEWERMFEDRAMQIDTILTPFLATLPEQPNPVDVMRHLAIRNLLKGYLFRLPTGQALAEALLKPTDRLTQEELKAACTSKQVTVLTSNGFLDKTPLWFYILAEAKAKGGGNHLGPLGSLLVAETIIGLMRANLHSILNQPFFPTFGQRLGQFDLQDLLIKAGVQSRRI
jgi:hypothetical protein